VENCGRVVSNNGVTQVLANVIIAFAVDFSSHPLILGGAGRAPPPDELLNAPISLTSDVDYSEFGRRRASMRLKFKENAERMMRDRGTLVYLSEENATSCHLMEVLESRASILVFRSGNWESD